MGKFDVDAIRRETLLSDYLSKTGAKVIKDGREWKCSCPYHTDNTPSFTIYPARDGTQRFYCFSCGRPGDILDFIQEWHGVDFREACDIAGGKHDAPDVYRTPGPSPESYDPYKGFKLLLPPADVPPIVPGERTPDLLNPKRLDNAGQMQTVRYTPTLVHPYYSSKTGELAFYVLRVDIGDRKITPAIAWVRDKKNGAEGWSHFPIPEPRPIYGLPELVEQLGSQVLLVEGEKCRDVAATLSPKIVAISWMGGGKAIGKTNWRAVKQRRVVIWPDNDDAGDQTTWGYWKRDEWVPGLVELMLDNHAESVKVIDPPGEAKKKGWDIADARQEDGWSNQQILEYARDHGRFVTRSDVDERREATMPPEAKAAAEAPKHPPSADAQGDTTVLQAPPVQPAVSPAIIQTVQTKPNRADREPPPVRERVQHENVISLHGDPIVAFGDDWKAQLLTDEDGKLKPRMTTNAILMIANHNRLAGLFSYNEFTNSIYVTRRPIWEREAKLFSPRPITSKDVTWTTSTLEKLGVQLKDNDVGKAISAAADKVRINPVRDYLAGLKWDGTSRIQGGLDLDGRDRKPWLVEYVGAPDKPVMAAFGMRWLISAVARVFQPGCKVDSMLIFEGPQRARKSSLLRELGTFDNQSYFTDEIAEVGTKDSSQQLHGAWIVELAELDALSRADSSAIKAWLTRQVDRFRPAYAPLVQEFPRSNVFAGTVNPNGVGYLRDPTGGRRFWPVPVGKIDLERIIADKAQLWAEAVYLYRQGEQWWLTDEEEREAGIVQGARFEADPWAAIIEKFTEDKASVYTEDLATELGIPMERRNTVTEKRIAAHLKAMGRVRHKIRDDLTRKSRWAWVFMDGEGSE